MPDETTCDTLPFCTTPTWPPRTFTALNPPLKHPPSWYWKQHCYATFMTDPVGLSLLERIGPETCLWSSDYPHQESTFGYTRSSIDAVFAVTSVESAQKIVGKTALELFRMT